MKKVYLGDNGPEVSQLIYSFWRALEEPEEIKLDKIRQKLDLCLEYGINTFDHADNYGGYKVEELFGKALKESSVKREEIVLSTKCGINIVDPSRPQHRIKHYDTSAGHIEKSVKRSLKNLRTDYIDILLLHHHDPLMNVDETASVLSKLVHEGSVRYIGVADFTVHQHRLLQSRLEIPIVTNHLELNLLNTGAITDGTIDFIKQQYSHPLAWAPLAGGRLLDKHDETTFNIRNTLRRIALQYHVNEEQLAIAWLLKLGALPVIGTNNVQRVRNSTLAVNLQIDRQDWYEIYFSAIQR